MSELTPLLSSTEDDLELLLLRSAEEDEPSAGALPKVAASLGVGAAALGLATGAAVVEHAGFGGAAAAKPVTFVSILKWLGAGMTAGALVGGGAHVAFRPMHAGTLAHSVAVAPTVTPGSPREVAREAVPPPPPAEPEAAETAADEPESATAESPAAVRLGAPPGPPTPPVPLTTTSPLGSTASFEAPARPAATNDRASSLADEVSTLDAARRELAAGRARSALAAIDAYRARFPTGALRTEATVLRVEALLGFGDRAAAEREANAIVRAAPGTRHAARVLDLLSK
jgi:hypothetical protein